MRPDSSRIQETSLTPRYAAVRAATESLAERGYGAVEEVRSAEEHLLFALPPELRRDLKAARPPAAPASTARTS